MNREVIENICRPVVEDAGYDLILAEWTGAGRHSVLRLYIDRVDAVGGNGEVGVGIDDCVLVSKRVSRELDVEDVIPGHYSLEVSTPGLDRPLAREKDFARFIGHEAKVKLRRPLPSGRKRLRGELVAAENGEVSMKVDGESFTFPVGDVAKANLVYED